MGPLAAWVLKKIDDVLDPVTPAGFEMLIGNFSLGISGMLLAIGGYYGIGPAVTVISDTLGAGVKFLVDSSLLPLVSILVEPAKVLFLNNAINFGVLAPLGVAEAAETGKSIAFMIETNPGPGLGILLAFWLAGPKVLRGSVPGAIVIHFLGGIHEIYFPYVLLKPKMILAAIAGGATGVGTFMVTGSGLVATPSPGSIFAWLAVTPPGNHVGVLLGIVLSASASFAVGWVLLKTGAQDDYADLAGAKTASKKMKKG
jgi:PTS system mannitol-specific IIC component